MNNKKVLLLVVFVFLASGLFYKQFFKLQDTTNPNEIFTNGTQEEKGTSSSETTSVPSLPLGNSSLDLSNKNLNKLPSYVLDRTGLVELNISNNQLTGALPAEIRFLAKLKVLDASDNQMTGVPAEIGQLSNLEVLDLSNNKLTGLPYELGNLKNLKILNLSGNSYSKQDLEIIKKGLPANVKITL